MQIKRGWVFLIALALQHFAVREEWYLSSAYPLMVGTSYALLLWGALSNIKRPGFRFLLAGTLMNLLPLIIHGWYMPVAPETLSAAGFVREASLPAGAPLMGSKSVLMTREATSLWMFTDIIPMSWPIHMIFSPGDLLILLGLCLLLWDTVKGLIHQNQPQQNPTAELRPE